MLIDATGFEVHLLRTRRCHVLHKLRARGLVAYLTVGELIEEASGNNPVSATVANLASRARTTERSMQRGIAECEELGLIERVPPTFYLLRPVRAAG